MRNGCLFCGGDADEPDHWERCDGRQGGVEAELAAEELEEDELEDDQLVRARNSDPETSHAAMAALKRAKVENAVGVVVQLHREYGRLASFQLHDLYAVRTGVTRGHMYFQARRVAGDRGLLRPTGETIVSPGTGRRQELWEVCDAAPLVIRKCPTCGKVVGRDEVA